MNQDSVPSRAVPEIPGQLAPDDEQHRLRHEVSRLLHRGNRSGFPGSQPVSFARKHINENLLSEDYLVCEKSDGLRCLLYMTYDPTTKEECNFLINRNNEYFFVPGLHFPRTADDFSQFITGTILDGELVISVNKETNEERLQYLMFDILVFDKKLLVDRTFNKRLGYLREFVERPLNQLYKMFPEDSAELTFETVMKKMEPSTGLQRVFESMSQLHHVSDGLIFTPLSRPYVCGTDQRLLKWKPPEENTIDFKLEFRFGDYTDEDTGETYTDYDNVPEQCNLQLWLGSSSHKFFDSIYLTEDEWENLKELGEPLVGRVAECNKDDESRWRFLRFRDDKMNANHESTVEKVIESINDKVDADELIEYIPEIRRKREEREQERHHQKRASENGDAQQPSKRQKQEV